MFKANRPPSQRMPDRITPLVLAEIVGIAADAIICVDDKQRITFFNHGAETIFGYERDEVIGERIETLIPERFRASHEGHVEAFGKSGIKARRMGERSEISALRKNGEEFPAEAAIAQLHHDNLVVYAVVLRDVTERKRFEQEIQRGLQLRDDMVGIVSHDLRNPVAAVKMLASAILGDAGQSVSGELRDNLELIRTASLQMETLISDLLDVTKLEAGQLAVNLEAHDANALADDAIATLLPLAEEKNIALETRLDKKAGEVLADEARIHQVLSNLVGNALKFTQPGGRVTVSTRALEDRVEFCVEDNGPGIPPAQLPHIFKRYWQSRRTERHGAGLGLPIAKGIIAAHHGTIHAESEPGGGTRVYFTLPRA
jgi:PAS domain S-box-containing protein